MNHKPGERGQALILIVFAAIALFAFAALAIDGSRVFSDRRHAQNTADTSALAAALAKIRAAGDDATKLAAAVDAAKLRAESNGFKDGVNSVVEVHQCDEVGLNPPCEALPAGADPTEYLQVVIRFTTPTTFARILGWQQVPTTVTAISRAKIGVPGGGTPMAAISALSPHDPNTIEAEGNFNLTINNGGIFDNSDAANGCPNTNALWFHGNGVYDIDQGIQVVGAGGTNYCNTGSNTLIGPGFSAGTPMNYPPSINIPPPAISCDPTPVAATYGATGWLVPAGTHNYQDLPGGNVTFAPGSHCFPAGYKLSGNSSSIVANDVKFLITGGGFDLNSNANFNCDNMIVYTRAPSTGLRFNGNGTNICTNVTFYLESGELYWGGNPLNNFSAPTDPTSPYKGLLVYLPLGNSGGVNVQGNSGSSYTGSIIAVSSTIEIGGNSQTLALSSQIIGYKVKLSGNGNYTINYDPNQQYAQGEPTMIQLTK